MKIGKLYVWGKLEDGRKGRSKKKSLSVIAKIIRACEVRTSRNGDGLGKHTR